MLRQLLDHYGMQQSLFAPSMLVQTETEEHVRGKKALEAPATVKRQTRGNLLGAFDSCVPFFSVLVGLLTSVSSVYCLLCLRAQRYCCTEQQF